MNRVRIPFIPLFLYQSSFYLEKVYNINTVNTVIHSAFTCHARPFILAPILVRQTIHLNHFAVHQKGLQP